MSSFVINVPLINVHLLCSGSSLSMRIIKTTISLRSHISDFACCQVRCHCEVKRDVHCVQSASDEVSECSSTNLKLLGDPSQNQPLRASPVVLMFCVHDSGMS